MKVFPSCIFLSLDVIHIIGHASIVPLIFEHFVFHLAFVGLLVQPCKCMIWLPFGLFFGFFLLVNFVVFWTI